MARHVAESGPSAACFSLPTCSRAGRSCKNRADPENLMSGPLHAGYWAEVINEEKEKALLHHVSNIVNERGH